MNVLTPHQRQALAEGLADLLRLRADDPAPAPHPRTAEAWEIEQRELDALDAARTALERRTGPDWYDEHLVHGQQRQDLLAWLTASHVDRTRGSTLRQVTDDFSYDDDPAKILRVLREEDFTEAARIPDYGGRDLRLLIHQRGWLAQVDITPRPTQPHARAYLSINALAVDHELLLTVPAWNYARNRDDRTSLIHGTALINGTGLRIMTALLRATTLPVNPWRTPALRSWLAGEPRFVANDPEHAVAAGLAIAETLTVLNTLPAAVRTLIEPDLHQRS